MTKAEKIEAYTASMKNAEKRLANGWISRSEEKRLADLILELKYLLSELTEN